MALTPTLSFTVRNDNKLLTIADTTVDYNIGGNIAVADITALTLDVEVVTSNNISTVYDTINLFSLFGPFANQAALEFELGKAKLKNG